MDGAQAAIEPGDAAWEQAAPLFAAVWPPEVRATFSWAHVIWANAERRIMVRNGAGALVCHVGLYSRQANWEGTTVKISGIGGVITRQDSRKRGYASAAINVAITEMKDTDDADFGLLFCEPHNFSFYRRLGWHQFAGEVFVKQPSGRILFDVMTPFVFDMRFAPRDGTLDLCGLPW